MMKIRCVIIDDNDLYRQTISEWISQMPSLELVASYTNPLEAQPLLAQEDIPLLFLDIEMPNISGLDFAQTLVKQPAIIFITSHPEFAIQGFEQDAADYLVKPFTYVRFVKAVNKAIDKIRLSKMREIPIELVSDNFIFVQTDKQYLKVNFQDILYIEALKEYVKIQTEGDSLISLVRIKSVLEQLPSYMFLRVHRSFIVNINKVSQITHEEVFLGKISIPIGESYREIIREKVIKDNLLKR
jgi:two-component system, LytTR family, response regulator